MPKKTPVSRPLPSQITYDRVHDLLAKFTEESGARWFSVLHIIDLMNGWDGKGTWQNASWKSARKMLQNYPGTTSHEKPTAAQMNATRHQLDKLVEAKLVEKERGHTDGNNSWGYRWITATIVRKRALRAEAAAKAENLAWRISIALGGDGLSGVQVFARPDDTFGIRVNLYTETAERLLAAIKEADLSPDFFTGKHWEILTPSGEVMGCTADREDVRREEPDATFREVKVEACSSCSGDKHSPMNWSNSHQVTPKAPAR